MEDSTDGLQVIGSLFLVKQLPNPTVWGSPPQNCSVINPQSTHGNDDGLTSDDVQEVVIPDGRAPLIANKCQGNCIRAK